MKPINKVTADDITAFVNSGAALDVYQSLATRSAIYPGIATPIGLSYVAKKLNGEAGEFAEHVGKAERDDGLIVIETLHASGGYVHFNPLLEWRRRALIHEIGDMLWYLSAACNELGTSLSEAAAENLRKLASRTERGTLQGSGDDR